MSNATDPTPENTPQAALDDNIARNRVFPVPDPETIQEAPKGFAVTPHEIRRKFLKYIGDKAEAEALAALRECAARKEKMKDDFGEGEGVPTAAKAAELAERLDKIQRGKARVETMLEFYNELEAIAISDAAVYLKKVQGEYNHFVKRKPYLKTLYQRLQIFTKAVSDAIKEGKKRAKKKKEEEKNRNK